MVMRSLLGGRIMQALDPKDQSLQPKPPAPEPGNKPEKEPGNHPEAPKAERPKPREEGVVSNPDFAG